MLSGGACSDFAFVFGGDRVWNCADSASLWNSRRHARTCPHGTLRSHAHHRRVLSLARHKPKIILLTKSVSGILGQGRDKMPLRSSLHLKINGVNGDATVDAFDGSFPVDGYDIAAPMSPFGTPPTFSFDVRALKASAAVS